MENNFELEKVTRSGESEDKEFTLEFANQEAVKTIVLRGAGEVKTTVNV